MDKATGRRISVLRAALAAAREDFDELVAELHDQPGAEAACDRALDAAHDAKRALNREYNMRGTDAIGNRSS